MILFIKYIINENELNFSKLNIYLFGCLYNVIMFIWDVVKVIEFFIKYDNMLLIGMLYWLVKFFLINNWELF